MGRICYLYGTNKRKVMKRTLLAMLAIAAMVAAGCDEAQIRDIMITTGADRYYGANVRPVAVE